MHQKGNEIIQNLFFSYCKYIRLKEILESAKSYMDVNIFLFFEGCKPLWYPVWGYYLSLHELLYRINISLPVAELWGTQPSLLVARHFMIEASDWQVSSQYHLRTSMETSPPPSSHISGDMQTEQEFTMIMNQNIRYRTSFLLLYLCTYMSSNILYIIKLIKKIQNLFCLILNIFSLIIVTDIHRVQR